MKSMLTAAALSAGLLLTASAFADVPADAPAGTTGLCKDGTYSSNATKRGACSGHKGVKTWYATDAAATPAAAAAPAPAPAAAATPAAAPAPTPAAAAAPAPAPAAKMAMPATGAAGGGPGMVWVNTSTKVYHCPGDKYYGKTKAGSYMTEDAAKAAGAHADHGKACS